MPERDFASASSDARRTIGTAIVCCGCTVEPGKNGRSSKSKWPCRLSPLEVERKRVAIFKHESQKDRALFPGTDLREFWQRAEARNAETARRYDALGLAEYEAIEGFVRWDGESGLEL